MRRLLVVTAAIAGAALVAAGAAISVLRLTGPLPSPTVHVTAPDHLVLAAGSAPAVPLPAGGSFLLQSDSGTELGSVDPDTARPIGSVTKVMTALLVLTSHPLQPGDDGPSLTLTTMDVAFFDQEAAAGGSTIPVQAGEILTERQLLLALLLPSANNIADTLAVWVAGDEPDFVSRENTEAASLGMTQSHFADASGISDATVASARDLVRLARAALGVAALADIVHTQSATLPDGTALRNLNILLSAGSDWLGLKTGWTGTAGGCLLFAARHTFAAGTAPVTLYGAALDQPADAGVDPDHPELGGAFAAARDGMAGAMAGYTAVDLASVTPSVQGSVSQPWGARSGVAAQPQHRTVIARVGQTLDLTVAAARPRPAPAAGAVVARVRSNSAGVALTWPVVTVSTVAEPSWWWHLLNG